MGPQLDSCGRPTIVTDARLFVVLQWGRNLIVAEGSLSRTRKSASPALQWGRNLIVAEGLRLDFSAGPIPESFNGAAT